MKNKTGLPLIALTAIIISLSSCGGSQKIVAPEAPVAAQAEPVEPGIAEDTIMIDSASMAENDDSKQEEANIPVDLPEYHGSYTKTIDLLHTKLNLTFDWQKQYVNGKASLKFTPHFYPLESFELDAKGFDIKKVELVKPKTALKYTNDGKKLTITLPSTFTRKDTFWIDIDYTAKPNEGETGGSEAILSDKGLYFINPTGEEIGKPSQIWSQGETESNSRWFPTIDKPNERCTGEITLTVQDSMTTLSNGLLVASKKNTDGTRTDTWKMDIPIAPYLYMIAVGKYAVVKDTWNGKEVSYYVEPKYKDDAKAIFNHTPEMLTYFSRILNYPYPWQKFSQIIVRDYVSGAMENTTAVVFGEFVQKTKRELIDNTNDGIVAHEMFHHWFGDLVTCESWSNLTLNEGFANYSEYLWNEYKYGKDVAENERLNQLEGYLNSIKQGSQHALIDFGYKDKENMFDAHSYNKGGLTLHMLRKYVGDDAFYTALNKYLRDNQFKSVEVHNLRLAFEAVTGEDLNWFFNQWYLHAGFPQLEVDNSYDSANKTLSVTVAQLQPIEDNLPIYILPTQIEAYDKSGNKRTFDIRIDKRTQTFEFDLDFEPSLVLLNPENDLVALINNKLTEEQEALRYMYCPDYFSRYFSITAIKDFNGEMGKKVLNKAIADSSWEIRAFALHKMDVANNPDQLGAIKKAALTDKNSNVRAFAIDILGNLSDKSNVELFKKYINETDAYPVTASALKALYITDQKEAVTQAHKLYNENNSAIVLVIGQIFSEQKDTSALEYFKSKSMQVDGYDAINFYAMYENLLQETSPKIILQHANTLSKIALADGGSLWRKIGVTKTIKDLQKFSEEKAEDIQSPEMENWKTNASNLNFMFQEIKKKENNPQLKSYYNML